MNNIDTIVKEAARQGHGLGSEQLEPIIRTAIALATAQQQPTVTSPPLPAPEPVLPPPVAPKPAPPAPLPGKAMPKVISAKPKHRR